MTSCAWIWLYVGAFLMLLELLSPGFIVFFFGLSAMTVGICRFLFGEAFGASWQAFAFSVFTIFYLLFLRRCMKKLLVGDSETSSGDINHNSIGREAKVTTEIVPPRAGRVMLGDAEWSAVADIQISAGATVKVVSQNNLTLKVKQI